MDELLGAAARALSLGDPLGALSRVALREDAPALALRGLALAQLGELAEARALLRRAGRGFAGPTAALPRARCLAAEAEVALAARDLAAAGRGLLQALRTFDEHGDRSNAAHVRLLQLRRLLLLGRVGEAELLQASLDLRGAPARLQAIAALGAFELAVRRGHSQPARRALIRAGRLAARAAIPALVAEIAQAERVLQLPAAQLVARGQARPVTLAEVEEVLASPDLVVDACRRVLRRGPRLVELVRRPVLFSLARALAEVWPAPASRAHIIERAFGARRANASHRARLRVELGRLRALLRGLATVRAVPDGFGLEVPRGEVVTLSPPFVDAPADAVTASLLALLADGQAWSTGALALALGISQRTVQRALAAGAARALGRGRAQRWLAAPLPGFMTALLLPAAPAIG